MHRNIAYLIALFGSERVAQAQDYFTLPPSSNPPVTTPAPDPPLLPEPLAAPFGSQGQLVLSNDIDLAITYTRYDESKAEFFHLFIAPSIDWFVVRNVSIGITTGGHYSDTRGYGATNSIIHTTSTFASIGPRVSWNLPLGRYVSFNPRLMGGVEFYHSDTSANDGGPIGLPDPVATTSPNVVGPWLTIYAPLLVHPIRHFFLGFGPYLYHAFGRVTGATDAGAEQTNLGAHAVIGTYTGGVTPPASSELTRKRRFGDHRDVVISGSNSLSANWTSYTGTSSSYGSFSFAPAIDLFVGYRVALGGSFYVSYGKGKGIDSVSKLDVTDETFSVGVAPRIAYDIPLGDWLSLYPRVHLAFGYEKHAVLSGVNRNAFGSATINLGVYLPVLVHFAPHAFAGFGPQVSYDVLSNDDYGRKNPGVSVGASSIIGGWL